MQLPTSSEIEIAGVRASECVDDLWMPVRRLDNQENDWIEIAQGVHNIYISHIQNFGPP